MKRKSPPTATVYGCSTNISLRSQYPETWHFEQHQVTVDEAHKLIEAPYVVVNADRFGSASLFRNSRDVVETGWSVYALGLIEDEAMDAAEQAIEALQADIDAGNIKRGAHRQWIPRNPLEAAGEAELRAYREKVLRDLERAA